MTSEEETIFLVDNVITIRRNQNPQPFSLESMDAIESLALAAWDESNNNMEDTNSTYSFNTGTNAYDDDTASVVTISTTTTTTNCPSVIYVSLADLKKMRINNNYNTTTSVISKQKIKDESPAESLKNSVLSLIISNDSSTIRNNNSSCQEEISIIPSLGIPKISLEEFEIFKLEKQKKLCGWVKCLWPQLKLPNARQLANRLNPHSLLKRRLNPLTIGTIIIHKSVQMISTAIIKGTKHSSSRIEKDGQIRFVGDPVIIRGLYDPREYLLLHCPTYRNPPYHNDDPRIPWTEQFLLNKVLPKLANEASRIQNEVGLYLTVKETLLRGLEQYSLYECKLCTTRTIIRTFTYNGVCEHLLSNIHKVKYISDEDLIKVNLRAYTTTFYKNLPPIIVFEQ
jgi:hypothetical protein